MITVDIIRPEKLSSGTGPATILQKIIANKQIYHAQGIDVNVFTVQEDLSDKKLRVSYKKKYIDILRKILHNWAIIEPHIARWLIKRNVKKCQDFMSYYIGLNRTPDIVEVESPMDAYFYLKMRTNKNPKLITFFHTDGIPLKMYEIYYPCIVGKKYWKHLMECEEYVARNVDCRVFITTIGKKNYQKFFGFVKDEDTCVIVNGIDDIDGNILKRAKDNINDKEKFKYRLICSGTICNRKGQYLVVDALSMLDKDVLDNFHVTFIGDGTDKKKLEKIVCRRGLGRHISFLGKIKNTEVLQHLMDNNIYILMSLNEGLPISILEAMRCSMPVIASNVSGIPETVDNGYNGILLPPNAIKLKSIFENMDKYDWDAMGKNSRDKYLDKFTLKRNQDDYCKMIKYIFNKKDGKYISK